MTVRLVSRAFGLIALAVVVPFGLASCVGGAPSAPTESGTTSASAAAPQASTTPTPAPTTDAPVLPAPVEGQPQPDPQTAPLQLLDASYDSSSASIVVSAVVGDRVAEGDCILTVTNQQASETATVPAVADATVTYCASVSVAIPNGAQGTWDYDLVYRDSISSGSVKGTVQVR